MVCADAQTAAVQLRERTRTSTGKSAAGTWAPEITSSTRPVTENEGGGDGEPGCIELGVLLADPHATIDGIAHRITAKMMSFLTRIFLSRNAERSVVSATPMFHGISAIKGTSARRSKSMGLRRWRASRTAET